MGSQALPAGMGPISRSLLLAALGTITVVVFGPSLKAAALLGLHDERYLQVVVAPLACAFLVFLKRRAIFSHTRYSPRVGIPLLAATAILGIASVMTEGGPEGMGLFLAMSALVLVWMAAFVTWFGVRSFRTAIYPLGCLLLMAPLPAPWMDRIATALQHGSAEVSYQILRLSGIPVFRHGMLFSLRGLDFEVAPECSGIHSSLALLMIAVVGGYLCLRSGWSRWALIALTVPIVLVKNALRISVISTLGAYVDRVYVDGPFHHQFGGLLFSVVGIGLFVLVLAGLQIVERRVFGCPVPQS